MITLPVLPAQNLLKELMNDDDVIWIAETEIYFTLETEGPKKEYPSELQESGIQTTLEIIKISPDIFTKEGMSHVSNNNALTELVYKAVIDGKVFPENNLGAPETMTYFSDIDTFVSFDPSTSEETLETVYNDDVLIEGYIGKLLWSYNRKEKNIYSHLVSYKPISGNYVENKNEVVIFNMNANSKHDFNDSNILWSKVTKIEEFDFSKSKILKGKTAPVFEELFKTNIQNKFYKSYSPEGNVSSFQSYTELEFDDLVGVEIDTFISVDPVTFEEVIITSARELVDFEIIPITSFVHYWYWDEDSNSLSCELLTIAVMNENLCYGKPCLLDVFKIKAQNNINE